MGTIADKLNKVLETKNAIKQALINKGVNISDTDSFESYVDKIDSISGGASQGVIFWLDGQCNTRNGKDHTKTYMENLVYVNNGSSTTGYLEYLQSGSKNSWDGDFLALGNYAYYPYIYNKTNLTVESLIKITKAPSANLIWSSCGNKGGWYLLIDPAQKIRFGVYQGSSYATITTDITLELDKPYYVVATFEANNQLTLRLCNVENSLKTTASTANMTYNLSNLGVGTQANTSTAVNGSHYDGLKIGMVRAWNRTLTDEEITANYNEVINRFGVNNG